MKLYEYQAKKIFIENKIPIPNGSLCLTAEEAKNEFANVGKGQEVVLKPQVLVGGRGRSGYINVAKSEDETVKTFKELIGMSIKGLSVSKILIEEKIVKGQVYNIRLLERHIIYHEPWQWGDRLSGR